MDKSGNYSRTVFYFHFCLSIFFSHFSVTIHLSFSPVKMFFKLMLICGLCSLFHAAFSAAQYRSYLRVSEQKFTGSLPMDIMIQAFVSLLVTLYSVVSIYCNFKVIFANDDFVTKSYGHVFSTPPSLVTFNHRGRILTSKQL